MRPIRKPQIVGQPANRRETGGVMGRGGAAMPRREPLNDQQKRLLKIAARMPLASVANLAPVLDLEEDKIRRMLGALRRGGWVELGGAGHDRAQAAPLVPDPPGRGPALRHRPPASGAQGGGKGRRAGLLPPRGGTARGLPGAGSPWTTTIPSTWRVRAIPPSPPVIRLMETAAAPTTSTRPGPPRRGAWKCLCAGWPCWSRSTA